MGIFLLLLILYILGEALSIIALVGEDVTLLYDPKQSTDLTEKPVKWTTNKTKFDFVHLHRKGPVHFELQNPAYRGRTILSAENLERGIIALTLIRVRLADEGNYTCSLPSLGKVYTIQLLVGAVPPPVITLEEFHGSSLLLRCESVGWYPRPQLSWGHSEGPPLPAVTMNTTKGPAGLYSISSTAVVERSQSCRYTCRVHQEQINQTRETWIRFPGTSCDVV
ncbi:unnamed protein product [Lota lota]